MKLIDKLIRSRIPLKEDYSTNPVFPNDTSYVGFFFEKNICELRKADRLRYRQMKEDILQREAEYREKFGDDWRNVAVHQAYRMVRESADSLLVLSEDHFSIDQLQNLIAHFELEGNTEALDAIEAYLDAEEAEDYAMAKAMAEKIRKMSESTE